MPTPNDTRVVWDGDVFVQRLPGCRVRRRLRINSEWYNACATALEWCLDRGALTDAELDQGLRTILASYVEFSPLERTIIFNYATHRREA